LAFILKMKKAIKQLIKKLPIAFTQNQRYDRQTNRIIERVCKQDSTCIDIGAHKGEVLDTILKYAPKGIHYAFEPIPDLYTALKAKYIDRPQCRIYDIALSNQKGTSSFNYVISNPSYSGLKKRKYDRENEQDTLITVQTDRLDNVLPADTKVALIKIDVEGGEMLVLEGAVETIKRTRPVIVFEHGLGASDHYGSSPEKLFDLLTGCGLHISLMISWLEHKPALTREQFKNIYDRNSDYYFIAYP
jgi:FkbM family methyltransferase